LKTLLTLELVCFSVGTMSTLSIIQFLCYIRYTLIPEAS
jgi:hypothetical protein